MKVIFHIGMGKTGTTAIQGALHDNQATLADDGVVYLGMWFDMINVTFSGFGGMQRFLAEQGANAAEQAGIFHAHISEISAADGAHTFIFSNEALFLNTKAIFPFLSALGALPNVDLIIVGYLRNPADWLLSAYAQWGIKHKTVEGPIRPFHNMAPGLLNHYEAIRAWHGRFGHILMVRAFEKTVNVVDDFGAAFGIELRNAEVRRLERDEWAELLLRREFNNLFKEPTLPNRYDQAIWGTQRPAMVPSINDITAKISDQSQIKALIASKSELFNFIEDQFGIVFEKAGEKSAPVDSDTVRDRMLDYLMSIVVRQSKRIERLEQLVGDFSIDDNSED